MTWKRTFNFSGRSRRMEYWSLTLIMFIIIFLLDSTRKVALDNNHELIFNILSTIGGLAIFIHLLPGLSVTIRRLHDSGKSGIWTLIILIPLIGPLTLLLFMFLDSEKRTNHWGPSPKYTSHSSYQSLAEDIIDDLM